MDSADTYTLVTPRSMEAEIDAQFWARVVALKHTANHWRTYQTFLFALELALAAEYTDRNPLINPLLQHLSDTHFSKDGRGSPHYIHVIDTILTICEEMDKQEVAHV